MQMGGVGFVLPKVDLEIVTIIIPILAQVEGLEIRSVIATKWKCIWKILHGRSRRDSRA